MSILEDSQKLDKVFCCETWVLFNSYNVVYSGIVDKMPKNRGSSNGDCAIDTERTLKSHHIITFFLFEWTFYNP